MESRKHQILQTAAHLFADKGFTAASMRDISAELGVEAASLYSHIDSKEDMLYEIIFPLAEKLLSHLDEVNDIYFNGEEKLRLAVRNHINILCEDIDAFLVFNQEWRHLSAPHLEEFKAMRHRYERGILQILETGMEENVFTQSDKKFATLTILSSLNWVAQWYKPNGPMRPEQIADKLSEILLNGLKKQKPF